jgi:hypothetical protein
MHHPLPMGGDLHLERAFSSPQPVRRELVMEFFQTR